jgi:predicted Zn-dependent peptidase
VRLLSLATPAERIVSFRGSFLAFPDFAAGDELRQELAVSMLDKGTTQRDRFALARVLEDCGAQLSLSSDGLYVDVSGRALAADLPKVLDVLAEMLAHPLFDEAEFAKQKAQTAADLQQQLDSTRAQAGGALARRLFGPTHPNFSPAPETLLAELDALTLDDVRAYHAAHFGARDLTFVVVGDLDGGALDHDAVTDLVTEHLGDWPPHAADPSHAEAAAPEAPGRAVVPMPDRDNLDVRLGHALDLRRDHDDYLPLYVGNYVLGGNFSARLMAAVRDEQGLTYGIGSSLSGMSTRYDGYFRVAVGLSGADLERGLDATRAEIARFVDEGVTADELAGKKTTITGAFTVGLATTSQLAQTLLTNAERGFDTAYLDDFCPAVEALTLDAVNAAVRRHLRPDALHVAVAGTVPEATKAG